jgi:hypothetical protein
MKDDLTTQKLFKKRQNALYYKQHKEHLKEYARLKHYQLDGEVLKEKQQAYYRKNKKKILEQVKVWQKENNLYIKEYCKLRKHKNRELLIKYKQDYPEKYRSQISKYNSKLSSRLRNYLLRALKSQNTKKYISAVDLVGCTMKELKLYIESQWLPGMTWANHTRKGWHIDHIKPTNTFDLTDIKQQKQCFHYTNLRPLWATDNLSRPKNGSDTIDR